VLGRAGCAAEQAFLQDLAGLDVGTVESAAVDLLFADQAVAHVEEQGAEDFLVSRQPRCVDGEAGPTNCGQADAEANSSLP
jgi:hypothetical protein